MSKPCSPILYNVFPLIPNQCTTHIPLTYLENHLYHLLECTHTSLKHTQRGNPQANLDILQPHLAHMCLVMLYDNGLSCDLQIKSQPLNYLDAPLPNTVCPPFSSTPQWGDYKLRLILWVQTQGACVRYIGGHMCKMRIIVFECITSTI